MTIEEPTNQAKELRDRLKKLGYRLAAAPIQTEADGLSTFTLQPTSLAESEWALQLALQGGEEFEQAVRGEWTPPDSKKAPCRVCGRMIPMPPWPIIAGSLACLDCADK